MNLSDCAIPFDVDTSRARARLALAGRWPRLSRLVPFALFAWWVWRGVRIELAPSARKVSRS